MVDGPSKQVATTLDMVMSRSLARHNSLVFHLDDFVLSWGDFRETASEKKFKGYLKLLEDLPVVTFNLVSKLPRELQTTVSNIGSWIRRACGLRR